MTNNETEAKPQETSHNQSEQQDKQSTVAAEPDNEPLGFMSTVKSVLGAMIGVQSEEQRKKDFEKADPIKLILGGIIFTVVFILTILWVVRTALENAGS